MNVEITAISCLDVAYRDRAAALAGVLVHAWDAKGPGQIVVRRFDSPSAAYEPGAFFKRELPLLLSIIAEFNEPLLASSDHHRRLCVARRHRPAAPGWTPVRKLGVSHSHHWCCENKVSERHVVDPCAPRRKPAAAFCHLCRH